MVTHGPSLRGAPSRLPCGLAWAFSQDLPWHPPVGFDGMLHLSQFGLAHRKLDGSKILFFPERLPEKSGVVKIGTAHTSLRGHALARSSAYFDERQITNSTPARSLGIIALEMMQKKHYPDRDPDKKLTLNNPKQWSQDASNFLDANSGGTLKGLDKVRGPLQYSNNSNYH
jgi:hypothetical protein